MDESRARGTIIDAVATLTGRTVPPGFQIILKGFDYFDAPCGMIPDVEVHPAPFNGIIVPEWVWSRSTLLMMYGFTALELVNCYFMDKVTQFERGYAAKLAELAKRFAGREGTPEYRQADEELLVQLHVTHGYENVHLYRKLVSDPEVFDWFSNKQQWDCNGIIHALQLLCDEAPKRNIVKPWLHSRTKCLQTRIDHLVLLRDRRLDEARALRERITEDARTIDPTAIAA